MTTFQRARSEEQRELRRATILDTAAQMLTEMPVARITLNELSRRVGLAKSNVLRYFESREAILLELLDASWQEWADSLAKELPGPTEAPLPERGERVADVLAGSFAARPVFCDLLSAQASVLEHNLSSEVAARYKREALANVARLAELFALTLPELTPLGAERLAATTVMAAGTVWSHSQPSAAMLEAYEADPRLATFRLEFPETLRELLAILVAGVLARGR